MKKNKIEKKEQVIPHKELLTFSNLTNLDWQFVDLNIVENELEDSKIKKDKTKTNKLKDLLKPESFVRKDEESKIIGYPYLKNIYSEEELNSLSKKEKDEIIEKGLIEMRKAAGIGMEYLEKSSRDTQEGYFLNNWEVLYAADNYKLATEYVDQMV